MCFNHNVFTLNHFTLFKIILFTHERIKNIMIETHFLLVRYKNAVSKFLLLNLVTFWGQKKCVKINFFVKKPMFFTTKKKNFFSKNFTISTHF